MYLWWSLCTLYLLTYQVRVTIGDSGLCCFVVLWHLFMLINSLVCWLLNVESVSHRIGLWWLIVYYNHWNGILTLILYPFEKSSAMERSQNDDSYLSSWCSSWPPSFSLMFLTAIFLLDVLLDRYLSPWCFFLTAVFLLDVLLDHSFSPWCSWLLSPWCSSWPLSFSLMFLLTTIFLLDVPLGFSFSLFHWFCVLLYLVWWCACSKFESFCSVDVSVRFELLTIYVRLIKGTLSVWKIGRCHFGVVLFVITLWRPHCRIDVSFMCKWSKEVAGWK